MINYIKRILGINDLRADIRSLEQDIRFVRRSISQCGQLNKVRDENALSHKITLKKLEEKFNKFCVEMVDSDFEEVE